MKDYLVGIISVEQIHFGIETLSSLKKREFNYDEFENHASDVFGELKIQNMDTWALLFCYFVFLMLVQYEMNQKQDILFYLLLSVETLYNA